MNSIVKTNIFDFANSTSINDSWKMAELISQSDLVPKDYKNKPANIIVAAQMGNELGLKVMQSLQNIAVINSRPCVWGDALIGLVRASNKCDFVQETFNEETMTATCTAKRKDEQIEHSSSFSKEDAKLANLWGKSGTWQTYKKRMLQMRARAFCLRDVFADVLGGLQIAEEVLDYQEPIVVNEEYPQAEFYSNLIEWKRMVAEGEKTKPELIEFLASRINLSESQLKQLDNIDTPTMEGDLNNANSES